MEECKVEAFSGGMKVIGITGGIGSGKSVVSRILRLRGYSVYDCDSEARRLMEEDPDVRKNLIAILGEGAYAGEFLDRAYVASKIFGNKELRERVNGVVHKAVTADFLAYARIRGGVVFCESAILATSRLDRVCDSIWLVTAPEWERIERVKRRNGLTEEEICRRMDTQREEFESFLCPNVIEIKNGDGDMLLPQIYKHTEIIKPEEICLERF